MEQGAKSEPCSVEIRTWLSALGLSGNGYEEDFFNEGFTSVEQVCKLTDEDLKELAEAPNSLLSSLLSGEPQDSSDEVYEIDDEEFQKIAPTLIEPADSSQHSAVIDMLSDKSFVLRGPPGTGKAQTICNMIAAGISSGKKILFIADKEAALEVVRSRLTAAGISPYLLKAYGKKSSKKEFWDLKKEWKQSLIELVHQK